MKPKILVASAIHEDGLALLRDIAKISIDRPEIHSDEGMMREISGKAALVLAARNVDAPVMNVAREQSHRASRDVP